MSFKTKNLAVILVAFFVVSAEGFNLFEFLERKFSNVRPVYQPNPQQRRTHRRPPAPAPRWPQLQYNYDKPVDNVIEEQRPQPQPAPVQPPRQQYRPQYVEQPPQYQQPPPQYQHPQPQYEQPQQYEQPDPYRPTHFEYKEPEQPADIPVVQGKIRHQGPPAGFVYSEPTTHPPPTQATQAAFRYPEYDEIEVITAPPLGGHRHYASTYEVQVGTNFNAGQ